MKPWKKGIAGLIIIVPAVWFAGVRLADQRSPDEVRYDQLQRTRRLQVRFAIWRTMSWYKFLSETTGLNPVAHYQKQRDDLEQALIQSGGLVTVSFYGRHGFPPQGSRDQPTPQFVRGSLWEQSISLLCRPRDATAWQWAFCTITNRVGWGDLRKFAGNREEVDCYLPDGEVVDLGACQKWLNDSIASGWMVGVCASNRVLIVSHRKPEN